MHIDKVQTIGDIHERYNQQGAMIMLDANELKHWCEDIVHTYRDADFDTSSEVFRSKVRNCLQSMRILEQCGSQQKRDVLESVVFAELRKQFHHWVESKGSSHDLITWLGGFFVGVNSVLRM